jgi:translation initiation factor IF-3
MPFCLDSSSRTTVARSFSRLPVVAPDGLAKENHISEPRINDRIRVPEVRLVGPNGEQVGIVRVEDALRLAAESDLDLVEVAPMAKPPVAKLMDFGKFKYEAAIKEREARKNQVNTVIKEIKLRPKIDPHDYATKKGHVERFLKTGDKVKVTIMFRGREQSRPELGYRLLQRLAEDIGDLGFVESTPKQDGRNMVMVIGPTKKKAEAKAEQRRRREESAAAAALTQAPSKAARSKAAPATENPSTANPSTANPSTANPSTANPSTAKPSTAKPSTAKPSTAKPSTAKPSAAKPSTAKPSAAKPSTATPVEADTGTGGVATKIEAEVTAAE